MNIIMTGSTSFVGAATVRELLRRGHTVTAIVRPKSSKLDTILEGNEEALLSGRLLVTENDLSEPEKLLEKVTKPQDVFCHFGWGGSGSASRTDKALQEKNMEISLETVRTAEALGCSKFLFSGSQAEYGMHRDLITEETVCEPKSLYGEAKLAMREKGEKLCSELGLRYIHARIFSAYGLWWSPVWMRFWTIRKSLSVPAPRIGISSISTIWREEWRRSAKLRKARLRRFPIRSSTLEARRRKY